MIGRRAALGIQHREHLGPEALLYAAATEHPPQRRLFRVRVEELAAMIAGVVARARRR